MKQIQYFKQTWFVVLMVFAMGCSVVSNAFAQPMHALMENKIDLMTEQSVHCMQQMDAQSDVAKSDYAHHQTSSTQPESNSCETLQSTDHMTAVKNCPDCSKAYCQISHLAVSQQAVVLLQPTWELPTHMTKTAYQAQHLLGFTQEILRPPRA